MLSVSGTAHTGWSHANGSDVLDNTTFHSFMKTSEKRCYPVAFVIVQKFIINLYPGDGNYLQESSLRRDRLLFGCFRYLSYSTGCHNNVQLRG